MVPPIRVLLTAKPKGQIRTAKCAFAIFLPCWSSQLQGFPFAFSHGPDFRIRFVAGSCLHRVSQHLQGSYWSSLPGFHLPRCLAGSLAFSPSLFRWIPFPRWGVGMLPLVRRFSGRLRLRLVFRLSEDFDGQRFQKSSSTHRNASLPTYTPPHHLLRHAPLPFQTRLPLDA